MEGTIWSLLPPIVAIALALLTKEVYLSCLLYTSIYPECIDAMNEVVRHKINLFDDADKAKYYK